MTYSTLDNPIAPLLFGPMYRLIASHAATYHGPVYLCAVLLIVVLYVAALGAAGAIAARVTCWILVAVFVMSLASCASQPPPAPPIVYTPPPKIVIPADPYADLSPDVVAAIKNKQTPTLQDGIAVLFPYSANQQWTLYCQPLRATEIRLNPDERTDKDSVVLGDSVRWTIKVGEQAVMVEPLGTSADLNMSTNLIIHTNKRSYHLMLKLRGHYMAAVGWYYPAQIRQMEAARELAQRQAAAQAADTPPPAAGAPAIQQEASK